MIYLVEIIIYFQMINIIKKKKKITMRMIKILIIYYKVKIIIRKILIAKMFPIFKYIKEL